MRQIAPAAVLVLAMGGAAHAQIAPAFSVGREGPSTLDPQFLYNNIDNPGFPTAFAAGSASGLVGGDAVNGFSQRELVTQFLLCFSVDTFSTGLFGLDPVDNFPLAPYNVTDQATKGQAGGSAFLSTKAFDRRGMLGRGQSMRDRNNVLAINQSPEYVADFGLLSAFSPDADASGSPMDNIEGGGSEGALSSGGPLFFTVDDESTSYNRNDIIIDPTPLYPDQSGGDESVFLPATVLGLGTSDDIDAMAVFDTDADGFFSDGDQLLFSLTPVSPLLGAMGWSAADVLTFSFGDIEPSRFALASDLGLAAGDNLDMLELVPLRGTAENTILQKLAPLPAPGSVALLGTVFVLGCSRRRR